MKQSDLDSGPNWIHGTEHNPILDLAKETNTITFSPEGDNTSAAIDQLGHPMAEGKFKEHNEIMWEIIAAAFKHSNKGTAAIPQDTSLLDYFNTSIEDKGLSPASSEIVLQMAKIWGDFIGDPIERQSLKYLWLEECIDGGLIHPNPNLYSALTVPFRESVRRKYVQNHSRPCRRTRACEHRPPSFDQSHQDYHQPSIKS